MCVLGAENKGVKAQSPELPEDRNQGLRGRSSVPSFHRYLDKVGCTLSARGLEGTLKTCLAGHPSSLLIKALELSFLFF